MPFYTFASKTTSKQVVNHLAWCEITLQLNWIQNIDHSFTYTHFFLKANEVRRNWVSDHTWYLDHPRQTNRDESKIETIEAYLRASGMKRCYSNGEDPEFTQVVELDLCSVVASCSGPKRPHDRVPISTMKTDFANCLTSPIGFKASVLTIAKQTGICQFSPRADITPILCLQRKMQFNQLWSRLILGHKENFIIFVKDMDLFWDFGFQNRIIPC